MKAPTRLLLALAYTWLGYAGREALGGGEGLIRNGLIGLALLAALLFLPRLVLRLHRAPWIDGDASDLNASKKLHGK